MGCCRVGFIVRIDIFGINDPLIYAGEKLVNKYAWSTPDERLLPVFQQFAPIIELGCGANAYWSRWMNKEGNVDVVALDMSLNDGGLINATTNNKSEKNETKSDDDKTTGGLVIKQGSPTTLSEDEEIRNSDRTLFLCYPDEEDNQMPENSNKDEEEELQAPLSMAASCLEHYSGEYVIHVGELYGDTLSLEQAPFGRSSSSEFQQRLAGEYHCILKLKLNNNWLHVRDTLSVWKRTETCCMTFEKEDGEEEDDSDDDMYFKNIPPEEALPVDVAAPCCTHLLNPPCTNSADKKENSSIEDEKIDSTKGKKNKNKKKAKHDEVAGNAW